MKSGKFVTSSSQYVDISDNRDISKETLELCKTQDFLIFPEQQNERESVFAQESLAFYKFTKQSKPDVRIAFYADEDTFQVKSLHSYDIFMPIIFVATNILLPLAVGLVTNFVYDRMKGREHEDCNLNVKFVVQNDETIKELTYEGTIKDFEKAFEKIDITKL